MAEKKRTTRRAQKPENPDTAAESENPDTAPDKPINGVIVARVEADGKEQLQVQVLGDVRPAEAPVLLELGSKVARQQLGL